MNQDLRDYTWVFVGCGGTFYAASPYLAVLAKRYCRSKAILIDPDTIGSEDYDRQWPGYPNGWTKVEAAQNALCVEGATRLACRFRADDTVLEEATDGRPVLAIVNVDNDEARLDVANWLASRISPGIMVVSGCERNFGQCYPGVWDGGEAILDWRALHPDVGDTSAPPVNPCNLQDVRANALTGVLVGMCIEDVADWLRVVSSEFLSEFYWGIYPETKRVKMWESVVTAERTVAS